MDLLDWILVLVIAVCLFLAIRYMIKHKGGCCGTSCNGCSRNCNECNKKDEEKQ